MLIYIIYVYPIFHFTYLQTTPNKGRDIMLWYFTLYFNIFSFIK
jgi:hypothetical protein